jgi:hypothetical protein
VKTPKLIGNICIAFTKLSRVGLDGCDVLHVSRNIPSNYGHALLWLGVLCVGLRKGYVGHHIILWGHRCTTPPWLHLWPSIITWQSMNSSKWWHIAWLCTARLCGGGSLLYNNSSFIFLRWEKESLLQPIFLPLNEKPKSWVQNA